MTLQSLEFLIASRRLRRAGNLVDLQETRLGIDASYWIDILFKKIFNSPQEENSDFYQKLKACISDELLFIRNNKITPIVVFSGLKINTNKEKGYKSALPFVFSSLEQNTYLKNSANFFNLEVNPDKRAEKINQVVISILQELNIEFIRAPYSNLAQLSYFYNHPKQIIHSVYSNSSALMFDIDQIILDFNHESLSFNWLRKSNILASLEISSDQFLDLCVLSGIGSRFKGEVSSTFQDDHGLVKIYKNGLGILRNRTKGLSNKLQAESTDDFCRCKSMVVNHLVLYDDGKVKPLNTESSPSDLHLVISHALPPLIYQLFSKGLIDPTLINAILSGSLYETPPLEKGDCVEYKSLLMYVISPLYARSLALITPLLHSFYRTKKILCYSYFSTYPAELIDSKKFISLPPKLDTATNSFVWPIAHAEAATGGDRLPESYLGSASNHAFKAYLMGRSSGLALDVTEPIFIKTAEVESFQDQISWTSAMLHFTEWSDDSMLKKNEGTVQKLTSIKQLKAVMWLTALRHLGLAPPVKYSADNTVSPASNVTESVGYKLASVVADAAKKKVPVADVQQHHGQGRDLDLELVVLMALMLAKSGCFPLHHNNSTGESTNPGTGKSVNANENGNGDGNSNDNYFESIFLLLNSYKAEPTSTEAAKLGGLKTTRFGVGFLSMVDSLANALRLLFQSVLINLVLQNRISEHLFSHNLLNLSTSPCLFPLPFPFPDSILSGSTSQANNQTKTSESDPKQAGINTRTKFFSLVDFITLFGTRQETVSVVSSRQESLKAMKGVESSSPKSTSDCTLNQAELVAETANMLAKASAVLQPQTLADPSPGSASTSTSTLTGQICAFNEWKLTEKFKREISSFAESYGI